jgi:formylglycine-generating enzyme required for sulfatase activity
LNRLLPEAGADIKGSMRSYSELLEASGYGSRPKDFEEVIRILDNEIRLITPTDPEGKEEAVAGSVRPGGNYYQLTHDYLVHSIRDWLTRKQKETRRGRAELALADRAAVWNARLENRQLPSLLQWLQIRWLTYEKDWTPPQRRMMQKAGRKYAIRAGLAVAVIVLLTIGIREVNGRFQAASLVEQLANADTTQVPMIIDKLNRYRQWADPELNKEFDHAEADSPGKLHSALALLPSDESKTDFLRDRLLVATPQQFRIVRDQLSPRNVALIEPLWGIALNSKQPIHTRFQAACALAAYAPNDNRWKRICSLIAGHLVTLQAEDFSAFRQSLVPVKDQLLDPLISLYEQKSGREQSRLYAAEALALYAADDPKVLANLLMDADEQQFAIIFRKVENQGDRSKPHLLSELGKQIRPVQPIWNLRFFKWESNQRPLPADWRELTPPTDWNKVIGSPILDAVQTSHLSFFSWQLPQSTPTANILRARSTPTAKVPGEFFAAAATTEVELDESEYVITVVFDDGVRVWFDNEKVFENWNTNPTTRRAISIGRRKGKHRIQVDYLQIIGNYVLDFALVPTDETKESLVKRKANAAIGLLRTNQEQVVWPLLKQSPDPGVRSLLVHRLGLLGADAQAVIDQLDKESEISIRRALVLSLGGFGDVALPPEQRTILLPKFQAMYRTENDPGLHAAVEWLLKKWKQDAWVNETTQKLADDRGNRFMRLSEIRGLVSRTQEKAPPQWYVNGQGQTMVVIPGPVNFLMGAPPSEFGRSTNRFDESLHEQRIGHSYAIADKPVTIAQYYRFPRHQFLSPEFSTSKDCPANGLVWNNAALYCNWLSLVEGEPESEWCYEPNREGFFDEGMKVVPDYLNRRGYRLPTEAEWEYACRAGTMTTTYYGDSKDLMPMYSLNSMYAGRSSWPAGILKPNDFGLFDMLGNVTNVCQNLCEPHSDGVGWQITEDSGNGFMLSKNSLFPIRGAAWGMIQPPNYRCAANRLSGTTGNAQGSGFRVARTIK